MRLLCLLLLASLVTSMTVSMDVATDGIFSAMLTFSHVPHDTRYLSWNSVLHSRFHGSWLRVVDIASNATVPYTGAKARFSKRPLVSSYVSLVSGQEVVVSFKNDFELVAGRTYLLEPTVEFWDFFQGQMGNRSADSFAHIRPVVTSKPVMWHCRRNSFPSEGPALPAKTSITTKGCSASNIQKINDGWSEAVKQINAGVAIVSNNKATLYETWFGSPNAKRAEHVDKVIRTTHKYFGFANATFDCKGADCEDDVYAYVFPNDRTETVYLCGAYWSAPVYEQGNTMTHELAHFSYIGNTDDWSYGQSACKKLAINNPARAVDNSDNYSYFCEEAANDK